MKEVARDAHDRLFQLYESCGSAQYDALQRLREFDLPGLRESREWILPGMPGRG